ncbi:alpha/beta hydrolase [Nitrogeniibacter mangrovi]|uniref:Alpha/beta hydrolase n=1 Tax=Nitrogeniibacter mangrovi TaxID=2016596 RepID=A0A6C1B3X0_9RHOO|nr:alpha/beta hydrolase [Nitrogeniibacter mangrovi]QID18362.1 alpha/beta hydrolase [Nitrogeniibacter mangrovi]
MPLDQASQQLLQQLSDMGARPFHQMTPDEARAFLSSLRPAYGEGPPMQRVVEENLETERSQCRVRMFIPSAPVEGMIVHCHGGGWVTMSIDDFDVFARMLAAQSRCAVVLVDYRLAPEHPFPAALDDCQAALEWAADARTRHLGAPSLPLIVSGDSAGGNLAAVLVNRSAVGHGPALAMQVLIYPVTQARLDTESYLDPDNQLLLSRDDMAWFWDHYLPEPERREDPEASPLNAPDVSGVPPTLIVGAEMDVLNSDSDAYAEKLKAAGVPTRLQRFAGQMHVFATMTNVLPASAAAIEFIADEISKRLASR